MTMFIKIGHFPTIVIPLKNGIYVYSFRKAYWDKKELDYLRKWKEEWGRGNNF
ncbi:MAG: hypothetical protein NTU58_01460 [Candidatus Nealsonbacteria bacterium]|nr:hypothetical protein [Candidatus Nealsonbacteria bacterium]